MKRLIRCESNVYRGQFNQSYAGSHSSDSTVEILGTVIGGMELFHVTLSDFKYNDRGLFDDYFVGEAPKGSNINFFW